uniref:Protein kintoun n=1 Tax=Monopterus albus TaxID=43700 RepID=A0A3Q3JKM9_MONAL|nr:protein kintoun [Monopterus albus]
MEFGKTLKELNMTVDEMDRLSKAFRDEKFREMIRDYAQEISDPENRKRYEEEIKLLEQERGNSIEFIHPKPFKALKTSVDGKLKCFINICGNDKVGTPECKCGVSDDGRRGQCWSLPHSLHPGRADTDPKGNKIVIYDVIFHTDTLHIASKNKTFMDMVDSTAIQSIQDAFKVTLDRNNVRQMKTKYKGTPQPCVIRKPLPGYKAKEPTEKPDPPAFPYPDEKTPTTSLQSKPAESPATKSSTDAKLKSFQIQPQKTKEPTKPNYTVKYRSFIDLQDFRCSRDSVKSPRPKEIVVTIAMPLVKSVSDISLEVKEKSLLLECKKPAYRLELSLAYLVDEDKGEAKFNKQRGQLTVTLPVLPSNETFDLSLGPAETIGDVQSVSDSEWQAEESGEEQEEKEREGNKSEEKERGVGEEKEKEERKVEEHSVKQQTVMEKGEEEEEGQEKGEEQMWKDTDRVVGEGGKWSQGQKSKGDEADVEKKAKWMKPNSNGQECVEEKRGAVEQKSANIYESEVEEERKEQKQENEEEEGGIFNLHKRQDKKNKDKHNLLRDNGCDRAAEKTAFGITGFQSDIDSDQHTGSCVEEANSVTVHNRLVASHITEIQSDFITAEYSSCMAGEEEVNLDSCLETLPKRKTSDIQETEETICRTLKVEADAAFLKHTPSEESHTAAAVSATPPTTLSQTIIKDDCISQGTQEFYNAPATDKANASNTGGSGSKALPPPEELAMASEKREREDVDEDDLPAEQDKPLPVLLREIDKDGNETVISDHSTAGIIFQNTMIYELD